MQVVGNALRWSESVQGATLLAVGSSFPEFVTALVGVIFFPEDNPGRFCYALAPRGGSVVVVGAAQWWDSDTSRFCYWLRTVHKHWFCCVQRMHHYWMLHDLFAAGERRLEIAAKALLP